MAAEESRELSRRETRSTLELLIVAASNRGWQVQWFEEGGGARLVSSTGKPLEWPPPIRVRKSQIPGLLTEAVALRAVLTLPPSRATEIGLPLCVKPDVGSLGQGFRYVDDEAGLRAVTALADDLWVAQPFVRAAEYRVSLCANGAFAGAELLERKGSLSRWRDVTPQVSRFWLMDLAAVLRRLEVPVIGVDILLGVDNAAYMIDVNTAPDVAVHLATQSPRSLVESILDSWTQA